MRELTINEIMQVSGAGGECAGDSGGDSGNNYGGVSDTERPDGYAAGSDSLSA